MFKRSYLIIYYLPQHCVANDETYNNIISGAKKNPINPRNGITATLCMYSTVIKNNTTMYISTICYRFFQSSCRYPTMVELMYKLLHIRRYSLSSSGFHSLHKQVSASSFHVFRFLNFHHFHLKCPPLFCSITEHINI